MKTMIEELKTLREEGIDIRTPNYIIMYNSLTDSFLLDVPYDRKQIWFKEEGQEEQYLLDCTYNYPYVIKKGRKTYEDVWRALSPYTCGASLSNLKDSFYGDDGKEYVWVERMGEGCIALDRNKLTIIE